MKWTFWMGSWVSRVPLAALTLGAENVLGPRKGRDHVGKSDGRSKQHERLSDFDNAGTRGQSTAHMAVYRPFRSDRSRCSKLN